jgi:hypothetical protein
MGIINDQGVFIGPPLGDDEEAAITSFREDDDFSIELFDESIVLADLPNDIGIAFVKSSDSPADFATLALDGTNTSTIFIDNTAGSANLAISGNLNVSGFIFGKFEDITVGIASTSNLTVNSTLTFELTSNTNLRVHVRGTDGVIRSADLTLS